MLTGRLWAIEDMLTALLQEESIQLKAPNGIIKRLSKPDDENDQKPRTVGNGEDHAQPTESAPERTTTTAASNGSA